MEITIEKAVPTRAQDILSYLKTVGAETDNLTFGAEGLPVSIEAEQGFIADVNASEKSVMIVALDNGEIVGLASLNGNVRERMKHRASLAISVRKSHWGQGVGSKMLQYLVDFAKEVGVEIISLEVRQDNKRAIALYEKFGFEKNGEFKGFFKINGEYIDFYLMNLYIK